MEKITTLEQAIALREINDRFFHVMEKILDSGPSAGDKVLIRKPRKFVAQPTNKDQMLFFNDNGRKMEVFYTESGPAKIEINF